MEFESAWTVYLKLGRQVKVTHTDERKTVTTAALEKFLGFGLIKGVAPRHGKKIVRGFGNQTFGRI